MAGAGFAPAGLPGTASNSSLLKRAGSSLWSFAGKHKGEIALNAGLIALSLALPPVGGVLGAALGGGVLAGAATRVGMSMLGRLGGRTLLRFGVRAGARVLGRTGLRRAMTAGKFMRPVAAGVSNLISGTAKAVKSVAAGLATAASTLMGIFKHGGGLSTVMSGQDAPGADPGQAPGHSPESPDAAAQGPAEEPLPGEKNARALQAAMSPAPAAQAPARAAAAPSTQIAAPAHEVGI